MPASVNEIAWRTGTGVFVLMFAGLLLVPQTLLYLIAAMEKPWLALPLCLLVWLTWLLSVAGFSSCNQKKWLRPAATITGALWFIALTPLVFLWVKNGSGGGEAPWSVYAIVLSFPGCVLLSLAGIWLADRQE